LSNHFITVQGYFYFAGKLQMMNRLPVISQLLFFILMGSMPSAQIISKENPTYYCSLCGCENDSKTFDSSGICPACKMKLLRVGTFQL
jgi:hypothetical protein